MGTQNSLWTHSVFLSLEKKYTKMSQLHPFNASREANKFQEHCPLWGSPSQPGHWGHTPIKGFSGLFCSPQHPPHTPFDSAIWTTSSMSSDSHIISIGLMRVTLTCEADSLPPTENQSPWPPTPLLKKGRGLWTPSPGLPVPPSVLPCHLLQGHFSTWNMPRTPLGILLTAALDAIGQMGHF